MRPFTDRVQVSPFATLAPTGVIFTDLYAFSTPETVTLLSGLLAVNADLPVIVMTLPVTLVVYWPVRSPATFAPRPVATLSGLRP